MRRISLPNTGNFEAEKNWGCSLVQSRSWPPVRQDHEVPGTSTLSSGFPASRHSHIGTLRHLMASRVTLTRMPSAAVTARQLEPSRHDPRR